MCRFVAPKSSRLTSERVLHEDAHSTPITCPSQLRDVTNHLEEPRGKIGEFAHLVIQETHGTRLTRVRSISHRLNGN